MSRPLKNISDALLRERLITARNNLGRLDDQTKFFEDWLEMQDTRFAASLAEDMRPMFAPRDYSTMLVIATDAARMRLEDEINAVEDEIEQRELDAIDDRDPTGGLAA